MKTEAILTTRPMTRDGITGQHRGTASPRETVRGAADAVCGANSKS